MVGSIFISGAAFILYWLPTLNLPTERKIVPILGQLPPIIYSTIDHQNISLQEDRKELAILHFFTMAEEHTLSFSKIVDLQQAIRKQKKVKIISYFQQDSLLTSEQNMHLQSKWMIKSEKWVIEKKHYELTMKLSELYPSIDLVNYICLVDSLYQLRGLYDLQSPTIQAQIVTDLTELFRSN